MLDARNRRRRSTVPPADRTHNSQASLRDSSATTCRTTPTATIPAGTEPIAAENSSHRPAITAPSAAVTATAAIAVSARRRRAGIRRGPR